MGGVTGLVGVWGVGVCVCVRARGRGDLDYSTGAQLLCHLIVWHRLCDRFSTYAFANNDVVMQLRCIFAARKRNAERKVPVVMTERPRHGHCFSDANTPPCRG